MKNLNYLFLFYLPLFFIFNFSFHYFILWYTLIIIFTLFICKNIERLSNNEIFILFISILIIKFLFVFKSPILSDDIYRYLWEGQVFNHGFNPYILSPNSKELFFLIDNKIFPLINHKNLPAIYPPFIIYFNSIIAKICYSVVFYKSVLFVFDILTFFLIILICYKIGNSVRYSIIYWVCPLTTFEIEWSGHNDIVMIFLLLMAICFLLKEKKILSIIFYTFSVLSKFVYLIFGNIFIKKRILLFICLLMLLYLPFLQDFIKNFQSLQIYLQSWEFNGSLYKIFSIFIKNKFYVRLLLLMIFVVFWIFVNVRIKNIFKKFLYLILGFLICSPTVHPWYGLWILPFLCFEYTIEIYSFLILLPFSYHVLDKYLSQGIWQEDNFITFLIYLPVVLF